LQNIVANGVGNYLINGEHEDPKVTPPIRESVVAKNSPRLHNAETGGPYYGRQPCKAKCDGSR
jgi:hypothetical protein